MNFFDSISTSEKYEAPTIKHVDVLPDHIHQEADIRYLVKGDTIRKGVLITGMAVIRRRQGEREVDFLMVI